MSIIPAHAPAAWNLSQINQLVVQQEGLFGPLVAIGADSATTVLSFDTNQPNPTTNAVIGTQIGGVPQLPSGAKLVCQGTIFVSGKLELAAATR